MEDTKAKIKTETDKLDEAHENKKLVPFLISQRNDGTGFPVYPSAQLWGKMTADEKEEMKTSVGKIKKWDEYEADMKKHWPPEKREIRHKEIIRR